MYTTEAAAHTHPYAAPRTTAAVLDCALLALDAHLAELEPGEPVAVRAIGGYTIMSYGLRPADPAAGVDGLTCDIDTLTPSYPAAVRGAIRAVGIELGLARDWLNNDVVGQYDDGSAGPEAAEHLAGMVSAQWVPAELSSQLRHIDLQVADIPTLVRLKLAAVEDAALSGRNQDLPDVLSLLRADGVGSAGELDRQYGNYLLQYPQARAIVVQTMRTGTRGHGHSYSYSPETAEPGEVIDEIDELLGSDTDIDMLDRWTGDGVDADLDLY